MILISATLAAKPVVSEYGSRDIAGAVAAALVVPAIDADTDSEAAVTAIETEFGASTGLKVFIQESSPSKANVIAALTAIIDQVNSSSRYS